MSKDIGSCVAPALTSEPRADLKGSERLPVPELDGVSVAFGCITHMPKYETIPDEFKKWRGNPYTDAVSGWFFNGCKTEGRKLIADGKTFVARDGIDATKALRAIKAVLGSFEPKHEHKEAACGYMLSQWFELEKTP